MSILYFDCSSGISGNMVLGALTELTEGRQYLINELAKLNLDEYTVEYSTLSKNGIRGTHVHVALTAMTDHRTLKDINAIIDGSTLNDNIKSLAKRIFLRVAYAEGKIHSTPVEKVHFHEIGATDSIVDIVGTAILIDLLNPSHIYSGIINDGYGFINCAHGKISVPVPATSEIFAKANVPIKQLDINTELVTPTGAAIIAELAESFGPMPEIIPEKIGWGAGTKDFDIPNILKVTMGKPYDSPVSFEENRRSPTASHSGSVATKEPDIPSNNSVTVFETNLDDCTGEILGYTMDRLFDAGALDIFYTPIFMKKNRPAYMLTVICDNDMTGAMQDIIFRETTTIGIRMHTDRRYILNRKNITTDTPYGPLKAKKVTHNGKEYIYPEYESARELAKRNETPLKEIYSLKMDIKR